MSRALYIICCNLFNEFRNIYMCWAAFGAGSVVTKQAPVGFHFRCSAAFKPGIYIPEVLFVLFS